VSLHPEYPEAEQQLPAEAEPPSLADLYELHGRPDHDCGGTCTWCAAVAVEPAPIRCMVHRIRRCTICHPEPF